ncbi:MAG: S41 family peptidase [Streptosporangiaceae bacterium]
MTVGAVALLFAYGLGFAMSAEPARTTYEPAAHPQGVLEEATDRIAGAAADPVTRSALREAAITAMLKRLGDPWARYYPAADYGDFSRWLNGESKRVSADPEPSDVTVQTENKVTFIRVAVFTRGSGAKVRAAVPARSAGVILDLRGNPGGLLDEAVDTASAFLTDGPVVTYEKRGTPPELLRVTEPGDDNTPLVVLVDGGTASAAEIVAGSLRDRDRAVIVGSRTFGKGTVQEPVRLADGSAVELTVGRYQTPGGRNLEGVGIEPDVQVPVPGDSKRRAVDVLNGLTGHR